MKKYFSLALLLSGLILLAGCTKDMMINQNNLTHHRFELVEVNNQTVSAKEGAVFIEFGENMTLNGQLCNHFSGRYSLDNEVLTSRNLAMTRMLCAAPMLNKLDSLLPTMLQKGAKVSFNDNKLTLVQADNKLTFVLKDLM